MRAILKLILIFFCCQNLFAFIPFAGSHEEDPESIVQNVNVIHGDYSEEVIDLCVSGPDPLILSRFYSSQDTLDIACFGGWRLQPQTFFLICSDTKQRRYQNPQGTFEGVDIVIGMPDGSLLKFFGFLNWSSSSKFHIFTDEDDRGICNTAKGPPTSWTNVKNHTLYYHPESQSFKLHLSTGGKRIYTKSSEQFLLKEEILPTGNRIFYEYDSEHRLNKILMTNAKKTKTLSWIILDYSSSIVAKGSDGTFAEYHLRRDSSGNQLLTQVEKTASPLCIYHYQIESGKALLTRKELPNERYIEIQYEKAPKCRVETLSTPSSDTQFIYEEGTTEVQTPLGRKTLYSYDEEFRLTSIEDILNDTTYRIWRKTWGRGKDHSNLIAQSLEDSSGNTLYSKTFSYDQVGNILEETEQGNLTGQEDASYTKKYAYNCKEDEDILSQMNERGNGTLTAYQKGTSIIKRVELYKNNQAKKRTYYEYNEEGVLTRITIDNGNISSPNDLDHTPKKFITIITPKKDLPNLGAPEIIEEKYYDPETKSEHLLKKTIHHFDARGFIIKQDFYDRNGALAYSIEKDYDARGRLTYHTDPLGNQTIYTYDLNGNLIQKKTQDQTIELTYDLENNLTSISSPEKTASFAYDAAQNQTLEIDPLGNQTHYSYDPLGRLIEKTTGSATWSYAYDLFDNPIHITNPLKQTTTLQYTARGQPTHIACGDQEESFIYSLEGSLYRHTTTQGITKIYSYDYLGRLTHIKYFGRKLQKDPFKTDLYIYSTFHLCSEDTDKGQIHYKYNPAGKLIQQTVAQKDSTVCWSHGISWIENGDVTDYDYDALGRLIGTKKWKDKAHYTLYAQNYDFLGNVTHEWIENEQRKTLFRKKYTYTPTGMPFQEIRFPENKESILIEHTYDSLGRLSQIQKESSRWNITYKGLRKKAIRDPLGSSIEKTYNEAGLVASINQKSFAYNLLDALTQEKKAHFEINYSYSPQTFTTTISGEGQEIKKDCFYNSYGDLIKQTIPSSKKPIEYTYDSCGNLQSIRYQDMKYILNSDTQRKTTTVTKQDVFTLERTHNTSGQILSETLNDTWGKYTSCFKYDGEGCLTDITLPDSSSIRYLYEGPYVSKILRLSKEGEVLYFYEVAKRDLMGNVLEETLPFKLGERTYTYNTQGQKTAIHTSSFSDHITLDLLGNPLTQDTTYGSKKTEAQFTYDPLSQLISEKGYFTHTYSYDSLQNCQLKDDISYVLTPLNQTTEGNDFTCEYDASGNLISYSDSSKSQDLQFDSLGRPIIVQSNQKSIHYTYDPASRRLSTVINSKDVERYFYLGAFELGSLNKDGQIQTLRIPTDPNSPKATSIISIELEGYPYIPQIDLLGNVRCLIDPKNRSIIESYHFSAFGEEHIFNTRKKVSQSPLNNPWRFQGKRHDSETGLIYCGARYYHPKLQKWISPDPIGSHDSLNLYLFCHNNPLKYHDPWGLSATAKDCGCTKHNHPGYHQRPSGCICICGQGRTFSGVIDGIANTWNHPRFQGSLQAFGGLAEATIGGGMALASSGLAAPVGSLILAHGLDQFLTGIHTALSNNPHNSVTTQLLQRAGTPPHVADTIDTSMSLAGTLGGLAAIRMSQLASFPNFKLTFKFHPSETFINRAASFAGSRRAPLDYAPYQKVRNSPTIIHGRKYTGHALDRIQDRGFMPSVIENTIRNSEAIPGSFTSTLEHYDSVNKVKVIIGKDGQVITIIPGRG